MSKKSEKSSALSMAQKNALIGVLYYCDVVCHIIDTHFPGITAEYQKTIEKTISAQKFAETEKK